MTTKRPSITLNQAPFEWNLDDGDMTFFGLSSVLFWANPSLYRMLEPLVAETGPDLFRLLVAYSSSHGTDEDYNAMVTQLGSTFEEGFLAWGRAVGAAGWGAFELPMFDRESGRAVVRVRNPWELRMQKAGGKVWGCPFLQGKVIGILCHALGKGCWADEHIEVGGNEPSVEFRVYPSEKTIKRELDALRRRRLHEQQEELARQIEEAAVALAQKDEEVVQREELIRALSAPIIQVWDRVLAVPLSGSLGREQAARLTMELLERVVTLSAEHVILDLTGLSVVDAAAAGHIVATAAAVRLLGAQCAIVGLSPELARAMVDQDIALEVRTMRTLADALRDVVGLSRRPSGRSSVELR
jgi:rsbT co-antagonist protein RsbR